MPDTITTKPFQSQAQWRMAFARGEPWARRWAHETPGGIKKRYQRLPYKKRKEVAAQATATLAHGPGGLMSASGMDGMPKRKKRMPISAKPCASCPLATTKGEQIAPGITRIRGNLCNVHGRYGRCPGSSAAAKPKKGKQPKKIALTPEQRQQTRDAEHAKNTEDTLRSFNIAPDGQAALEALRKGEQPDASSVERHGFETAGLVERASDGSYRMTASGRALMSAAAAGDRGRAGDIISSARDRTSARTQRQQTAAERRRQSEQRRQEAQAKRQARQAAARNRQQAAEAKRQQRDQERQQREARSKRTRRKAMHTTKATGSPGDYLVVEDPKQSSKWHLQVRTNGKPDHRLMGAAWAALHGGYRGNTYQGPNKAQAISKLRQLYASEGMDVPGEKSSFTVFKQADGHYRWLGCTTNAYLDRDGEIISTKTLETDVARADADGQYGPLRWWHVGEPDPFNAVAPWGPGLDLGVCDFNAMSGRMLIESGTFKDDALGAMVAEHVKDFQFSPGFFHPLTDPDGAGVYHHIRRFERSLVPAGRAANPYTWLTVQKGQPNMLEEKVKQLKQLLGGTPEAETAVDTVVSEAGMAQKELEAQGVAYKDAPDWAQALIAEVTTLKAEIAALKAPADAGPDGGMMAGDMEGMTDQGVDEAVEPDGGGDGLTLSPEDISAIGQAVGQAVSAVLAGALQPLVASMDLSNKMGAGVQEIKTMLGAYQTQKDAQTTDIDARVKALEGDLPRGVADVYRASMAADTVMTKADAEAITGAAPEGPFDDLFRNLLGGTPIGNGVNPQIN